MNWHSKAAMHWLLSYLPGGSQLHYWIQRRVTGSIPRSDARLREAVEYAYAHVNSFHRYLGRSLNGALLFEFGAGWDLPVQLIFFAKGASRQVIVDRTRLIKKELVNDSIRRIREMGLGSPDRLPARMIEGNLEEELKEHYGIDYRAPCDARTSGLASNSVDLVTSTETLQHIPVADLFQILTECHRIVKPGGLITAAINYDDHYAFFDRHISVYNFLQYSDNAWRRYNPPTHYQNRLRHVEYIGLFRHAGFRLLYENPSYGSDADLGQLAHMPIDARFQRHSLEDLAVHGSYVVFMKDAPNAKRSRSTATPPPRGND